MKKNYRLHPMPDALTRLVDRGLANAKRNLSRDRRLVPVLFFFKDGEEHSIPLDYNIFLAVGAEIRKRTPKGVEHLETMGYTFAFFAMELAARGHRASDQMAFACNIEGLITQVAPQFIVTIQPTRKVRANPLEAILTMVMGGAPPASNPAILVVGRSPVRTHVKIAPITIKKDGSVRYLKEQIIDSLAGGREVCGDFSSIYMPCRN